MKKQVGKMASWQNDKLTRLCVDRMVTCQNDKLTKWQIDEMASLWNI
jgi:hypothetical protein